MSPPISAEDRYHRVMRGRRGRRDWDAFDEFCAREYPRLVGSIALIIGDADLAADSVCEALARAWKRHRRGGDIDSISAYVRVVALNVARDHFRHAAVEHKHLATLLPTLRTNLEHETWGLSVDVREVLESLPLRQREVVVLHFLCDLTVDTVAAELGIAPASVKSSLDRARARLRSALREEPEEVLHDAS
jgi:RNA polymerase sigma-70 factor, ECF subfamily